MPRQIGKNRQCTKHTDTIDFKSFLCLCKETKETNKTPNKIAVSQENEKQD